jgi:hypothetical protein
MYITYSKEILTRYKKEYDEYDEYNFRSGIETDSNIPVDEEMYQHCLDLLFEFCVNILKSKLKKQEFTMVDVLQVMGLESIPLSIIYVNKYLISGATLMGFLCNNDDFMEEYHTMSIEERSEILKAMKIILHMKQ